MKVFYLSAIVFCYSFLQAQDIEYFTSGNGSYYEMSRANQAMNCLSRGCLSGLTRTKFINENTEYDSLNLTDYVEVLNEFELKEFVTEKPIHYNGNIPDLHFYRTFYHEESREVLFQVQLILMYENGSSFAKKLVFKKKDFVFTSQDTPQNHLDYKYNNETRVNFNVPLPPPPPPPETRFEVIYQGNLCPDCKYKSPYAKKANGKYLLRDKYEYTYFRKLGQKRFLVSRDSLFGIINFDNEVIIPLEYDKIDVRSSDFKSKKGERCSLVKAQKDGLYSVFYSDGERIISGNFQEINIRVIWVGKNTSLVFILKKDDSYGVMNSDGEVIIPFQYDSISLHRSTRFKVEKNGLFGVIYADGRVALEAEYKEIDLDATRAIYYDKIVYRKKKRKKLILMTEEGEIRIVKIKSRKFAEKFK